MPRPTSRPAGRGRSWVHHDRGHPDYALPPRRVALKARPLFPDQASGSVVQGRKSQASDGMADALAASRESRLPRGG